MNRPDKTMTCERASDLIESYFDGDLDSVEAAAFESHLISCPECAAELKLARRIVDGLDTLTLHHCPADVTAAVLAHAASHPLPRPRKQWWQAWRPALAGAIAGVLLLVTAYVGQNARIAEPQYTRAELEQARAEAKWTLVYIGQLSRRTASDLEREVLAPHVARKLMRVIDPKSNSAPKENEHES